jgi:hypothetical protein
MMSLLEKKAERDIRTSTDDEKWQAVLAKDAKQDGKFYYAVRTTGVYCLPSCPARPPLRENIVSNGRFYAKSMEALGMTPEKFRKGGVGARIRFAVGECSLGSVLVAASEKGVCAISLGDDPDSLVRDLQDQGQEMA